MGIRELLEKLQGKEKFEGADRRKFARLIYPPDKRPTLNVREHTLEVIDISEGGLKFLNYLKKGFGKKVFGTAALLSDQTIEITGNIVWEARDEYGLLISPIPRPVIIEEVRALLRGMGPEGSSQSSASAPPD